VLDNLALNTIQTVLDVISRERDTKVLQMLKQAYFSEPLAQSQQSEQIKAP